MIRFKEDVGDVARLREKEKGDWKKLTKAILPYSLIQVIQPNICQLYNHFILAILIICIRAVDPDPHGSAFISPPGSVSRR